MTPIIEFKNYTFKYRSQSEPTLRDIDLRVNPGEKVLIVGPSGSGKSTLVHCINGMVPFSYPGESSGTLTVGGKDPAKTGIFGMSKIVGTVLQDTDGQFIGLTVAEDVAFALENDCVEQEEMFRAVDEVAEVVDIKALLGNAPTELSGGQKQRVSMAGVLVDDVDILLFDEPLANLDPATGKRAIDLIDRICRERHKTVIIIEHRLEDALYRDVDRIVVIGDGRVVADMTPDELLASDILIQEVCDGAQTCGMSGCGKGSSSAYRDDASGALSGKGKDLVREGFPAGDSGRGKAGPRSAGSGLFLYYRQTDPVGYSFPY